MIESSSLPRRLGVFGAYSDHDLYQRNRVLVNILRELSNETVIVRPEQRSSGHGFSLGKPLLQRLSGFLRDGWSLWSQRSQLKDCDTIFVPYPAYLDITLLWIAGFTKQKRVFADAFLELHSTVVEDRRLLPRGSFRARMLLAFQRFTLGKANVVLIDTAEQAALLKNLLAGTDVHVADVPVGIDESKWTPLPAPALIDCVQLLFWGSFIPLHGVEHIVRAVRILENRGVNLRLKMIGDGQLAAEIAARLADEPLRALSWDRRLVGTDAIRSAIADSHIVLGVFGDSEKAGSVIPYKVQQALASARPVITRRAAAAAGLVDPESGFMVCEPGDPAALAQTIQDVIARLKGGWAPDPRAIYEQHLSNRVLEERLMTALEYSFDGRSAAR